MINGPLFWIVLAGAALVHAVLPRYRALFLFLVSAGYLATLDYKSVLALLILSIPFYVAGQKLRVLPRWLVISLVVGVLVHLASFKYIPPILRAFSNGEPLTAPGVIVPLGASYFTFKLIHYILEASRRKIPDHSPDVFLAYMFFFPMFTAGPIERFEAFHANRAPKITGALVGEGIARILYGLAKKFVLADLVLSRSASPTRHLVEAIPVLHPALRIDQLATELPTLHSLFVWQFVITQWLRIYFDFSAYSDVAIGAGLLFGVRLTENFDYPILSPNISEFWRRWHISLSGFCQQYVYLPLIAYTRNPYVAVFATMTAIGLWHEGSLNYLGFGLFHATCIAGYLTWGRVKRKMKWKLKGRSFAFVGVVLTLLCVSAAQAFVSTAPFGIRFAVVVLGRLAGVPYAAFVSN